jgi:hypothetical protein
MSGLAALGAAVGIGMVFSGTFHPTQEPAGRRARRGRRLALTEMVTCEGVAVGGLIAGILAVMTDGQIGQWDGILAAGPAFVGAIIGLGLVVRHNQTADRALLPLAAMFITGPAVLGIVVALLGLFLGDVGARHPIEGPFFVLGLVSLGSALAIGETAARAIKSMEGADEATINGLATKQLLRSWVFQAISGVATIIAIVLILVR